MKLSRAVMSVAVVTSLITFSAGCGARTPEIDKSRLPSPDSPYVKVYVNKSGEVTLDGSAADLGEVESAFASLAEKKGVVLYARESPEQEPHPNAMRVIELITRHKLPTRLCATADCSDALDAQGRLKLPD